MFQVIAILYGKILQGIIVTCLTCGGIFG